MPGFLLKIMEITNSNIEIDIMKLRKYGGTVKRAMIRALYWPVIETFIFFIFPFIILLGYYSGKSSNGTYSDIKITWEQSCSILIFISCIFLGGRWITAFATPRNGRLRGEFGIQSSIEIAKRKYDEQRNFRRELRMPFYQSQTKERSQKIADTSKKSSEILRLISASNGLLYNLKHIAEQGALYAAFNATSVVLRPKEESPVLHGALANAVAGPVAGVYVASTVEEENRRKRENYERNRNEAVKNRIRNDSEISRSRTSASSIIRDIYSNENKIIENLKSVPEYKVFLNEISIKYDSNTNLDYIAFKCFDEKSDIALFILDRLMFISEVRTHLNLSEKAYMLNYGLGQTQLLLSEEVSDKILNLDTITAYDRQKIKEKVNKERKANAFERRFTTFYIITILIGVIAGLIFLIYSLIIS